MLQKKIGPTVELKKNDISALVKIGVSDADWIRNTVRILKNAPKNSCRQNQCEFSFSC
jgi:hypothetical protein